MRNFLTALGIVALPATGLAIDCGFGGVDAQDFYKKAPFSEVTKCIQGDGVEVSDPRSDLLPSEGRFGGNRVSGASGFATNVVASPDQPPGVMNAKSSISKGAKDQAFSLPPWAGFPCQMPGGFNICGGSGGGGSGGSGSGGSGSGGSGSGGTPISNCPVSADTAGTFGQQQPLTVAASVVLPCGGTVPLTNYQMTLNKSPSGVFGTEENAYNYWSYRLQGSGATLSYKLASASGARLPTYLCMPTGPLNEMEKSVDLEPARAQFVVFNAATTAIAIRLRKHEPDAMEMANMTPEQALELENQPEKYLIVPVSDGVPQIPGDCAKETDYYKVISAAPGDVVVESSAIDNCETWPEQCAAVGINPNPTTNDACDTVTLYPDSTATPSCHGSTQFAVIDRPNMIHPPGSTPITIPIEGRTGHMTSADKDSTIYMPYDTIIHIGPSAPDIKFPQGGILTISNTSMLSMSGPATVRASSGQVIMPNGGELTNASGTVTQTFGENATFAPPVAPPYKVKANRDFVLPANYQVPTQPSPFVRLPVPEAP